MYSEDIKEDNIWLMKGDCLERMKEIPDGSVDMVLADPPYGTTACKWDSVIPFEPMWEQLKRIVKANGAIVLFGSEPFSSVLRVSNLKMFKYDWIWEKEQGIGFANANKMPMKNTRLFLFFTRNCQNTTHRGYNLSVRKLKEKKQMSESIWVKTVYQIQIMSKNIPIIQHLS